MSKMDIALAVRYLTHLAFRYMEKPSLIKEHFENYSTLEDYRLTLDDYQTLAHRIFCEDFNDFLDSLVKYIIEDHSEPWEIIPNLVNMEKEIFNRITSN